MLSGMGGKGPVCSKPDNCDAVSHDARDSNEFIGDRIYHRWYDISFLLLNKCAFM